MDAYDVLRTYDEQTLVESAALRLNQLLRSDITFNQLVAAVVERRTGRDPFSDEGEEAMNASLDVSLEVLAKFGLTLTQGVEAWNGGERPGYL